MFEGIGNIASLLKQARNMSGQMGGMTDELKEKRVTGTAGGGMITVVANGLGVVLSVEIDDVLKEKGDMEMIQDLMPVAINDASGKAKALHVEFMQGMTGGMNMPAGMEDMMKKMTGMIDEPSDSDSNPTGDSGG